jgi:rhamnogalacturonan acetylesterase
MSLGARVIISPPTPLNPYQYGNYSWAPSIYSYYAWYVAQQLGGPEAGAYFVDHSSYAAHAEYLLGADFINPLYPMDNTHTAPVLAAIFAQAWVFGLKCGTSPLQDYVVNATSRIEGPTFGTCQTVNATLPI